MRLFFILAKQDKLIDFEKINKNHLLDWTVMSIGLKRGTVLLEEHQLSWEENAKETYLEGKREIISRLLQEAERGLLLKPLLEEGWQP